MFDYPIPGENSFINYQEFLTSGTWYRPNYQKWTKSWILCIGGGGSGAIGTSAGAPGYGGGGGAITQRMAFLKEDSYSVIVGAGGVSFSGTSGNGYTGGATSFGSIVNANGGVGGTASAIGTGGSAELYNYKSGTLYFPDFLAQSIPGNGSYLYSAWNYKRHSGAFAPGTGLGGAKGHNGNGGNGSGGSPSANSGAGSGGYRSFGTPVTVGVGGSGYCIIFWEDKLKYSKKYAGNTHLKIQEFSSSGTWYRPKRFPATFAYIFLVSTAATPVWCFAAHFLTEDNYSFVISNPSSFGGIVSTSYYGTYTCNGLNAYKHLNGITGATSKTVRAWPFETLAPTTSFIMWYE